MNNNPPIILLMGPTAAGKTDAALGLAQHFPVEIISVDSALVYKEMDIGTAKPSPDILRELPHHLIDIRDPADSYSVADFCDDVKALIPEILARGKYPLLVGGTMMYYKALVNGLSELPGADPAIRAELDEIALEQGWEVLHERLAKIDPETAARLHPNDAQRIQRALEINLLTGKSLSDNWEQSHALLPYDFKSFAVAPPEREVLHQRIAERFLHMIKNGLIEEVQHLMQRGDLHLNMPSMRAVGYRQVWEGLSENQPLEDIIERGTAATRQLAKRQLTWLRHWPDVVWFDSTQHDMLDKLTLSVARYWVS